jgi:uncharacterized membrane protein
MSLPVEGVYAAIIVLMAGILTICLRALLPREVASTGVS